MRRDDRIAQVVVAFCAMVILVHILRGLMTSPSRVPSEPSKAELPRKVSSGASEPETTPPITESAPSESNPLEEVDVMATPEAPNLSVPAETRAADFPDPRDEDLARTSPSADSETMRRQTRLPPDLIDRIVEGQPYANRDDLLRRIPRNAAEAQLIQTWISAAP